MISEAVGHSRAGRAWASRNRYAGSWSTRFPAINGSGLHIVRCGAPWLIPAEGAPIPLCPGDVAFLPHGPRHGFSHTPCSFSELPAEREKPPEPAAYDVDFVSCCYHLDRGRVHESLGGLPEIVTLTIDGDRHPALRALTDLLGEHASGGGAGDDLALPAIMDLLLIHLLRARHDGEGGGDAPEPAEPGIARVLRAVQEDPHRLWTVGQLSDLARMSRASFARRFTEATGETPRAYLIRRRLNHGAQLLRHTELPLASIAPRLGYSTEFSFAAAFRREFGIAPGRFRTRERTRTA